jgi:DNA-binding transcriptional ArsR family regulator
MLEYLFANKNVEKILAYLLVHGRCYATELSRVFASALDPIQKTLAKLERGGLLCSAMEGRVRVFAWNPDYPFLGEIQALARRLYDCLPLELRRRIETARDQLLSHAQQRLAES